MTYSDPGQPPQASPTPQPYGQQPMAGAEDPGKTLGIVGLVLAFVFSLAGLIVSIIARNKSKEAGFDNGFAKWGIILSIVFMVVGIIFGIIGIVAALSIGSEAMQSLDEICSVYGPGTHDVGGVEYTCS
ncbi:DUF4190 domain-containing protein [Myceligenerans pegani]|uniref:DUF4190 domain-containing protein n=1 Tax=Myceligenerans pegani TaxID=2776917 RepID=A0ABR9MUY5_9MICO|nr:DUF4190 domain-containing protein [Myceligenerans sp. TRM 65318]MBE1874749.1 DUF4190 domain-containing protein [Myceligenerans sp. TRM 65318]MBE3017020.1 DUF4190 domain-containing protein [Myceligenerans sp. TRM 65318]